MEELGGNNILFSDAQVQSKISGRQQYKKWATVESGGLVDEVDKSLFCYLRQTKGPHWLTRGPITTQSSLRSCLTLRHFFS